MEFLLTRRNFRIESGQSSTVIFLDRERFREPFGTLHVVFSCVGENRLRETASIPGRIGGFDCNFVGLNVNGLRRVKIRLCNSKHLQGKTMDVPRKIGESDRIT